ncbi:ABC transporter substrate-binding protein [Limnochorda pilosa]|uniref:Sugar ABC transporter substrate-binding protein n=1 Tax=Limnochorda pilosa TaxID=1555112 RepID=A0A0K2SMK5_LIMPI|nr:extracellular solute-binding protein [Limnochorda pilosa]BAS28059.1 sugar ABC transporter substrate-binding protein [Limnochorda pilosa]
MGRRYVALVGWLFLVLLASSLTASAQVTLRVTGWPYEVDVVNENLQRFQQQTGISALFTPFPSDNYRDRMVASFVGGTEFDVVYVRDNFLAEWASAGWIMPIDDLPGVQKYIDDMPASMVHQLSYSGHLYGLPYYSGLRVLAYNAEHLQRAGFEEPARTWHELLEQARAIRAGGIAEHPIILQLKKGMYITNTLEDMTVSRGGVLFDDDHEPQFHQEGSAFRDALAWLKRALAEGLVDEASLNSDDHDVTRALSAGTHSFTIVADYDVRTMNDPSSSREAGHIRNGLIPGTDTVRSGTTAYVRLYAITTASRNKEEAWKLLQFLGGRDATGEYYVPKRWAIEFGLGFAYDSMFEDPEIVAALGTWSDLDAWREQAKYTVGRPYRFTPWFAEWDVSAWDVFQNILTGRSDEGQSLERLADEWTDLREEYW